MWIKSTVRRHVHRVSTSIATKAGEFIKWPTEERKKEIKLGFYEKMDFQELLDAVTAPMHTTEYMSKLYVIMRVN